VLTETGVLHRNANIAPQMRSWSRFRALLSALVFAGCGQPDRPPNVVLITLDTTRADHLSLYGYAGDTSPNLDRFALDSVVYEHAYATSSWTLASHASLFTGLLPMQHGAQSVPEGPNRVLGYGVRPLAAEFSTLAERLGEAGFRRAAIVAGPALRSELGVAQGFETYLLDLPGFGKSNPPPVGWSVLDYAKLVIAYLDSQNLAQVHLIGHSFGGRVGLILGAEFAERIDKMVLIDSAGIRTPLSASSKLRLKSYRAGLNMLERMGMRQQADQLRAWYAGRYGSRDYKAASGVMRETFVKVVNEDLLTYAARVAVPTLLMWGDQDQDTPLWQGQKLEDTIPDAGLVVWEGAGHYSYLDRLADTVRVIDHFFKQNGV